MSAASGFEERAKVNGAKNINEAFFAQDILFADTPAGLQRAIQIQISTSEASQLEITLDGQSTWKPINNQVAVSGLGTFTILVEKDTALNFRNTDVAGLVITAVVGV